MPHLQGSVKRLRWFERHIASGRCRSFCEKHVTNAEMLRARKNHNSFFQ